MALSIASWVYLFLWAVVPSGIPSSSMWLVFQVSTGTPHMMNGSGYLVWSLWALASWNSIVLSGAICAPILLNSCVNMSLTSCVVICGGTMTVGSSRYASRIVGACVFFQCYSSFLC